MTTLPTYRWDSEAKKDDIDFQGIVNNSVYLNYLDLARRDVLATKGGDVIQMNKDGLNTVLVHVDIKFKKSLKLRDKFYIKTTYEKSGKLRIIFHQKIYCTETHKLIAEADSTIACVSVDTGKPVAWSHILP